MVKAPTLDKNQKTLHENFPSSSYLSDPAHVERLIAWITFYRRNPSRFVEHYMGIQLHLYQHIILCLIVLFPNFCIVAARSAAKSFIIAIYGCMQSVLYPGSHIVIASGTKGQAKLIVTEKIVKEILPRSPLLQAEIAKVRDGQNEIEVTFHNGSTIVVVAANDNARGHRATVLVLEEFRLISKDILDTVLTPFLVMRSADFFNLPEYAHLKEPEKSIYISSAWYKSHWMWKDIVVSFTKEMISGDRYCVLAMDYAITLRHGLKSMEFMIHEKMTHDPISWTIEYENRMMSENAKAFFTYEQLDKNRRLKKAFYPRKNEDVLLRRKNPFEIPKQNGEVRIVTCDIAMESASGNDNSIYACIRLLPESYERKVMETDGNHIEMKRGYRRQVSYMEPMHGGETTKQAIRIKQLYADFDADYCILDCRNAGRLMPARRETYGVETLEKSGTLKRQPEWKAVSKSTVTRNAYEVNLSNQNIIFARASVA